MARPVVVLPRVALGDRSLRDRALRAAVLALAVLASLAVLLGATGWLYVVRYLPVPGPVVRDALPLDELSRRAGVPLLTFVGVWALAAVVLGLVVRAVRAERLTAALLLALGTGVWTYLASGVSILVTRQVPAHDAFYAAATLRAVYLPAGVAGLAGALFGRPRVSARPRSPLVLAWAVATAGALGVLDGILPKHGQTLIDQLAPERVHPLASALVAPLGLALLVVARGLARRKRRAWQVGVALLAGMFALQILYSFHHGAILSGLIALALVARRHDFDAPGDPDAHPRILWRALVLLLVVFGYGVVAIWVNRLMADQPFTLPFALHETSLALVGLTLHGSAHLTGDFGEWFPLSMLLAGLAGAALLLVSWLGPWRYRLRQEARERELARSLIDAWGIDTLAPFVLRADKSYFFSEDERAFLAYKVVGGVAIVSGDPIGPVEAFGPLVARFKRFTHERGWRVAILGASERWLGVYREQGLHALYHGDEAVLETASFSLEGRAIRKVRQSVHRLKREGYTAEVLRAAEIGRELRAELEAIAAEWRAGEPERGFVMALDALFRLGADDAVFVIGRDAQRRPRGFLHFAVCHAGSAVSLSSMPRLRETPNGFNEWLVCETVEWAREEGYERISLNFAPFAALLAPEAELSALQKVQRQALMALKGHFQLDNLLHFNRKFFPSWQRRFVVYERRLDLPRVGIAALAAEAYLPFADRERR